MRTQTFSSILQRSSTSTILGKENFGCLCCKKLPGAERAVGVFDFLDSDDSISLTVYQRLLSKIKHPKLKIAQ